MCPTSNDVTVFRSIVIVLRGCGTAEYYSSAFVESVRVEWQSSTAEGCRGVGAELTGAAALEHS